MAYRWRFEDSAGAEISASDCAGGEHEFVGQDEAEQWLGECWPDLLSGGVDQVVLLADNAPVYGPMSLHPPE